MDVTALLKGQAEPIEQRSLIRCYVSVNRPAPTAFPTAAETEKGENLLWVLSPGDVTPLGPCEWPACHGSALPKQGAECIVAFDENNKPVVIWWEGIAAGFTASRETLAIAGNVSAEEFPGFYVEVGTGETLHLIAAHYTLLGGTSVKVEVRKNKSAITGYESLAVTTSGGSTTSSKALSNGDYINWKTSAPVGAKGLSVTLFLK